MAAVRAMDQKDVSDEQYSKKSKCLPKNVYLPGEFEVGKRG